MINIFNAVLAAIMLVIVTLSIREWIQVIMEGREEERRQRQKIKFHKWTYLGEKYGKKSK